MNDNAIDILAERLLAILTEWHQGDAEQFQRYQGRLEEIKQILRQSKISKEDLVAGLEAIQFSEKLALHILGGNRA